MLQEAGQLEQAKQNRRTCRIFLSTTARENTPAISFGKLAPVPAVAVAGFSVV